jgi:4-hydroxybenzoyl-CoA reductase subunit beta
VTDPGFHRPEGLSEALALLQQTPAVYVIAGGTDLAVLIKDRLVVPTALVDLSGIRELKGTEWSHDGLMVGSMTPLWQLERSGPLAESYPALREAILNIAAPPIRNQATLGGNLCLDSKCIYYNQSRLWERRLARCIKAGGEVCHVDPRAGVCCAVLAADSTGPLLAYDAQVEIASADHRCWAPLATFLTGDGLAPHRLGRDAILTAVHLPAPRPHRGVAYDRFSFRRALEFSQVNLTASIQVDGGSLIAGAKLIVSAIGPAPVEVAESLAPLVGAPLPDELPAEVTEGVIDECVRRAKSPRLTRHLQSVLAARTPGVLLAAYRRAMAGAEAN